MYTTARFEQNGQISEVARFSSIAQAREWAASNGHVLQKGAAAKAALSSGASVRTYGLDGRLVF